MLRRSAPAPRSGGAEGRVPWALHGDTGQAEQRSPGREAAVALAPLTAAPRGDFKTPVLSQAAHSLTSFPAECCCNHRALARLLLPSYKWFILTSGPFLLKSTSRYRAGDFSWQQRTPILGQRKQLCAALLPSEHHTQLWHRLALHNLPSHPPAPPTPSPLLL